MCLMLKRSVIMLILSLVASLYCDLYLAAEILQSNRILQNVQLPNSDIRCNSLYTVRCLWVVNNSLLHIWHGHGKSSRSSQKCSQGIGLQWPEQLRVTETFVQGRDVFAVLPTGYGKSLCYACLPIVFDKLLATGGAWADGSIVR